jgi:hypothetical protein
MARELAGRADGPVDQLAGAIGAKAAERSRAVHAKRALEGTDPRVGRVRRQVPIAALTAGSNLEHPRLLPQERAGSSPRAVAFALCGNPFFPGDSIPFGGFPPPAGGSPRARRKGFAVNRESHQAFLILRFGFTVAPIIAGLDKFLQILTHWDKYLAPAAGRPGDPRCVRLSGRALRPDGELGPGATPATPADLAPGSGAAESEDYSALSRFWLLAPISCASAAILASRRTGRTGNA